MRYLIILLTYSYCERHEVQSEQQATWFWAVIHRVRVRVRVRVRGRVRVRLRVRVRVRQATWFWAVIHRLRVRGRVRVRVTVRVRQATWFWAVIHRGRAPLSHHSDRVMATLWGIFWLVVALYIMLWTTPWSSIQRPTRGDTPSR